MPADPYALSASRLYDAMLAVTDRVKADCDARLAALDRSAAAEVKAQKIRRNLASLAANFTRLSYERSPEKYASIFLFTRFRDVYGDVAASLEGEELRKFVVFYNACLWLRTDFADRDAAELPLARESGDIAREHELTVKLAVYEEIFAAWRHVWANLGIKGTECPV